MKLIKLQCSSCGGPLEIKPGIDRVRCPYCGMNYYLERKGTSGYANPGANATGDHPVDIVLVPLPENLISLSKSTDLSSAETCVLESQGTFFSVDKINGFKGLDEELTKLARIIAPVQYLTKKTYTIDVGNQVLNPVLMYFDNNRAAGEAVLAEEISHLVTANNIYHDNVKPAAITLTKPPRGRIWYSKKENDKANRDKSAALKTLMTKWHMTYADEVRYSKPFVRSERKKTLFGWKDATRTFTKQYTIRRLSFEMGDELAKAFLSDQDISNINRIGQNECIGEMAEIIYREFSKDAKRQLELRQYGEITVEVQTKQIIIKNLRNKTIQYGTDGKQTYSWAPIYIQYSNYGMSDINRLDVECFLTAHLINHINHMIESNGDTRWNLRYCYTSDRMSPNNDSGVHLEFSPALKTEGVYQNWI